MAKTPHKLRKAEERFGMLDKVIPDMVNRYGQVETARQLGLSQFTVSRWLRDNGYEKRIVWEKQEMHT